MKKAGKISGELLARGKQIDREDCIIGATALLADEPVLTRNVLTQGLVHSHEINK